MELIGTCTCRIAMARETEIGGKEEELRSHLYWLDWVSSKLCTPYDHEEPPTVIEMLILLYQVHRHINTCTMSCTSNQLTYLNLQNSNLTYTCGSIKLHCLYQQETGCLRAIHFTRKIYSNNKQQDWGHLHDIRNKWSTVFLYLPHSVYHFMPLEG